MKAGNYPAFFYLRTKANLYCMHFTTDANELLMQLPQIVVDANIWWRTRHVLPTYAGMKKRGFYLILSPHLNFSELSHPLILHGHKKTGKSTMLMHLIEGLLGNNINPHHILLVKVSHCLKHNIDIKALIDNYLNMFDNKDMAVKYLFIDDLELYDNWGETLQSIYSEIMGIKIICTSTLIPAKQREALKEYDFEIFMLPQLTFYEYVGMVGGETIQIEDDVEPISTDEVDRLNAFFAGYLKFVTDYKESPGENENTPMDIFTGLFPGHIDFRITQNHLNIWFYLLRHLSEYFCVEELAYNTQTSVQEVNDFMKLTQDYSILHYLPKFAAQATDGAPCFRPLLINLSSISKFLKNEFNIKDTNHHIFESVVHCQWEHIYPIHMKSAPLPEADVSMIRIDDEGAMQWITIVNYTNDLKNNIQWLAALAEFCLQNQIYFPVITTLDYSGFIEYKGVLFSFQPLSIYTYSVGRHILESRITYK